MNDNLKLNKFTKVLVVFVIIDFLLFFILEAVFWMQPFVHNLLLDWFNNPPASLSYKMQALVLKKLFVNQGFYNLFFAIGGIVGLYQLKRNLSAGYALILLVSFAATGAGLVLAATSDAYLLVLLQAVPALVVFCKIYPLYHNSLK